MTRPPVTVAALVGDDRQTTRGFVALLTDVLSARDNVVLVGPGRAPTSPGSWRVLKGRRLTRPADHPALHSIIAVVDERAVPVGPWLEPLVTSLKDPGIEAAAARTNIADGDELLLGIPYRPHETDRHRTFVRMLAASRAGEVTPVDCLGGPSLALRRSTLDRLGGLPSLLSPAPVTELAQRIADAGGQLAVAEGSYLHHGGGRSPRPAPSPSGRYPFVSACLITRDEHENLPRCLASIETFVDEVVVYDTGSVDDTMEIARSHGATVVEGHWDGDFARARNEALARCRGQWVLWIDADEELVCEDPTASRATLANLSSDIEGFVVLIDNLRGTRASTVLSHPACRLFRRGYGHWTGRLHEQVAAREGLIELATPLSVDLRITHWGYLATAINGRDKGRRNIQSAFGDITGEADLSWGYRLLNLGRSYGLAGRPEEAVALCRAAERAAENPGTRRSALRTVIENLLTLGRAEEALEEISRLRCLLSSAMLADTLEGRALMVLGRYEEALAALDRVVDDLDDDGYEHTVHGVAADKAKVLRQLDRHSEAADVLLAGLRAAGGMDAHVLLLVDSLERAGRPLVELPRAVPADRSVTFLGQLVHLEPDVADRVLEAWYTTDPSTAVLATASTVGGLPVDRLVVWSGRLREAGLARACPLVAMTSDRSRLVSDRLVGAALAMTRFEDPRGRQAFAALCAQLAVEERPSVRQRLSAMAGDLVGAFDALCSLTAKLAEPPADRSEWAISSSASAPETTSEPEIASVEGVEDVWKPSVGAKYRDPSTARTVLVLDRVVASLRTVAVAIALRRHGHRITLAHPQPAAQTEELLREEGIEVAGWVEPADDQAWERHMTAFVARAYAERTFDTVVVAGSAATILGKLRQLLPGADLVVDADGDAPPFLAMGVTPDLVLTSGAAPSIPDNASVHLPVSASFALPSITDVPEVVRAGACVLGHTRTVGEAELARWTVVATAMARRLEGVPVAIIGDDPDGHLRRALPGALVLGPLADPRPWLATARVAVVTVMTGAEHWLGAAAMCGTPALLVPDDPDQLAQLAPAVAALSDPAQTDLWQQFAPVAGPAPAQAGPDPLASLGAPRRPVRRQWPSDAPTVVRSGTPLDLSPATNGRLVIEPTWHLGGLPAEWLGALRDVVDEIKVGSVWAREHAIASGVDPDSVVVAPVRIDTERFAPHDHGIPLPTRKSTKLLFVGTAAEHDGIDALLESYLTAFSAKSDVCLVIHLTPGNDSPLVEDVRRAAGDRTGRPEVVVIEDELSDDERAALYRSCDLLVHPHRATTSLRPLAEAMASGLAVVTLESGPARQFCDERTGWLVECREVTVDPATADMTPSSHGFWQLEPDRTSLATVLRRAVRDPQQRLLKGLAARDRIAGAPAGAPSTPKPGWAPASSAIA